MSNFDVLNKFVYSVSVFETETYNLDRLNKFIEEAGRVERKEQDYQHQPVRFSEQSIRLSNELQGRLELSFCQRFTLFFSRKQSKAAKIADLIKDQMDSVRKHFYAKPFYETATAKTRFFIYFNREGRPIPASTPEEVRKLVVGIFIDLRKTIPPKLIQVFINRDPSNPAAERLQVPITIQNGQAKFDLEPILKDPCVISPRQKLGPDGEPVKIRPLVLPLDSLPERAEELRSAHPRAAAKVVPTVESVVTRFQSRSKEGPKDSAFVEELRRVQEKRRKGESFRSSTAPTSRAQDDRGVSSRLGNFSSVFVPSRNQLLEQISEATLSSLTNGNGIRTEALFDDSEVEPDSPSLSSDSGMENNSKQISTKGFPNTLVPSRNQLLSLNPKLDPFQDSLAIEPLSSSLNMRIEPNSPSVSSDSGIEDEVEPNSLEEPASPELGDREPESPSTFLPRVFHRGLPSKSLPPIQEIEEPASPEPEDFQPSLAVQKPEAVKKDPVILINASVLRKTRFRQA